MFRVRVAGWAVVVAVAGCGGGDGFDRQEVSGTVTLDGRPLANGLIEFAPLGGPPTPANGLIADGKYAIPRAQGPAPGAYAVRITASGRTDPVPVPEGHKGPPPIPKGWEPIELPERYNTKTELKATVATGPNQFAFDLTLKPAGKNPAGK